MATLKCRRKEIIPEQVDQEWRLFKNVLQTNFEQKPEDDSKSSIEKGFQEIGECVRKVSVEFLSYNELLRIVIVESVQ